MRTITVDFSGTADCKTIAEAMEIATAYDQIIVHEGSYQEHIVVNKPVQIIGSGLDTVLYLEGVTGINVDKANLSIAQLVIKTKDPLLKNLIFAENGQLQISNCLFEGGVIGISVTGYNAILSATNCAFSNFSETAIKFFNRSTGILKDCQIKSNQKGVIIRDGCNPLIRNCQISENAVGVKLDNLGEGLVEDSFFRRNGIGVLVADGSTPVVKRCRFEEDTLSILIEKAGLGIIEDCLISSCKKGILVSSGANPILRTVEISEAEEYGLIFQNNCSGMVQSCVITECRVGVLLTDKTNPLFRHTQISLCEKWGIHSEKDSGGLIEDSEICTNGEAGFKFETGSRTVIRNCRIHNNNGCGCLFTQQARASIAYTHFTDNKTGIIAEKGSWLEVIRSQIIRSEKNGIVVREKANGLIDRCYVCGNLGTGILIQGSSEPIIHESSISQNLGNGLSIEGRSIAVVVSNFITRNGQLQVYVEDGSIAKTKHNDIKQSEQSYMI